jgi:hypothetical protein
MTACIASTTVANPTVVLTEDDGTGGAFAGVIAKHATMSAANASALRSVVHC